MQLPYHNLQMKHWNPGATMPLILPINVICNTSDAQLNDNIRVNSRAKDNWLRFTPEHDGIAILCGSGPSIADNLDKIQELREKGGKVFAMNGCATYLFHNFILPDYQVILDARPETAQLVGPAKEHLFASQVHPDTFAKAPNAVLWQLQVEGIDDLLPEYDKGYTLIGGAASVGNTATCLAYAMGYRTLEVFGYDSSHRDDKGHAFDQPMNAGDPCAYVDFDGKTYLVSLTMKLQAEKFQATSRALKEAGCTINVHGDGLLPAMYNMIRTPMGERKKYELMYERSEYRIFSPGLAILDTFFEHAKPSGSIIDFGCGTGRAAKEMQKRGLDVQMVDFAFNAPDPDNDIPFFLHDMTKPIGLRADWGYCTDMMEHIPREDVDAVINNIMSCVPKAFFQICTCVETFGEVIGQELHVTVEDHFWWGNKFKSLGLTVLWDGRIDNEAESLFIVSKEMQ